MKLPSLKEIAPNLVFELNGKTFTTVQAFSTTSEAKKSRIAAIVSFSSGLAAKYCLRASCEAFLSC